MPTQRNYRDFSIDAAEILHSAGAQTATGAGTVSAAARVLDFGNTTGDIAYTEGLVAVDVSAIDFGTGDELYYLMVQLGSGSGFAGGDTVRVAAVLPMGNIDTPMANNTDDDSSTGRVIVGVNNLWKGTLFRYMRIAHAISGTTPSITYNAYFMR